MGLSQEFKLSEFVLLGFLHVYLYIAGSSYGNSYLLFQISLGISVGVGVIAGLLTLCLFYVGLFLLGN